MVLMLIAIVTLLVISMIWFIIEYRKESRKDRKIFNEYLENQRRSKFNRRGSGIKYSKKNGDISM